MKAVIYDKGNHPDTLVLRELEQPAPGDNQVLVKIHAVAINAADYRSMRMGIIPKSKIFGADIAGRVDAVGRGVTQWKPGDAVFGDTSGCGFGGFAEFVAVPASVLARKPEALSFEEAASLPMAALTALQGLRDRGNIRKGDKVLIYGAGGGVGNFAVQLAKYFGAQVTAVCSPNNTDLVRTLGADRVADYTLEDVLTGSQKFDLILGVNGSRSLTEYRSAMAPKGIFVMVGGGLSQVIKALLFGSLMSLGGRKIRSLAAKPSVKDLEMIAKLVDNGTIKAVIERMYPLSETAQAVQYASQGHARGKVIIQVAS